MEFDEAMRKYGVKQCYTVQHRVKNIIQHNNIQYKTLQYNTVQ